VAWSGIKQIRQKIGQDRIEQNRAEEDRAEQREEVENKK
jgi:hypothetical protein